MEEGYTFYSGVDEILHPRKEDGWLRLTGLRDESEVLAFSGMPAQLHAGEASCLAIARQRNWLLLTDDKDARRHGGNLKVAVAGTLGCLVLGIERNLWTLEEANGLLKRIIASGFYSPVTDLAGLLKKP